MSVTTQDTFAATLVDEWVGAGIRHAVVCPGSRSTPLALALAGRPEMAVHVRLDERSAGFYALGLSLATGRATVVCTTSGTAAAELHAAVVEAHHAGVALVVCTADRPPELQSVGAPQTIDQHRLYGGATRWFAAPGVADEATRGSWRSLASRAVAEAELGPLGPGPVHLNLAFREPLTGEPGALPPRRSGPYHQVHAAGAGLSRSVTGGALGPWGTGRDTPEKGLVVAGAGAGPPERVLALGEALGWPVLADPRSRCRLDHPYVVAAADAFLREPAVAGSLQPDGVLLLGAPWCSKVLASFLHRASDAGADVVATDPLWQWRDPDRLVGHVVAGPLGSWPGEGGDRPGGEWLERWAAVERAAQGAIARVIDHDAEVRHGLLTEPAVARRILSLVPGDATVVVSSSMPVRDLEWYAPPLPAPPPVLSNRGANGIDGVCSTARGVAAAARGPVVALVGDLAFLHDTSALVGPAPSGRPAGRTEHAPPRCVLVVLDNGGGGIFSFLPQASELDRARFETLFATPQAASVVQVAQGFGLPASDVSTTAQLDAALRAHLERDRLAVIRVAVPGRDENVALHDRLNAEVAKRAVAALGQQED